MKKISIKIWIYATVFLIEAILFNVTLAFGITALVFHAQGLTIWAITSIALLSVWVTLMLTKHIVWWYMAKIERALYLAIRKHGKKIISITSKEVSSKGQTDIHEILTDVDNGLEVQMIINGTGTFINVFIGFKWFIHANKFHKNNSTFEYVTK